MYKPAIHKRQSRRLNGHDYASAGLYFITLNTENRNKLFGEIKNGGMQLNEAGLIAQKCWLEIPEHFPHVTLLDFVIMPNHIHGIIEIIYNPNTVGAENFPPLPYSKTIGSIVRGFKIGVTKWIRQHTTIHEVWQRNYYDHIIHDTDSFERICQYIRDNPKNWNENDLS